MHGSEFIALLEEALAKHGFSYLGSIDYNSNKMQRLTCSKKRRGRDLFITIHSFGATFGDWRARETWITWYANGKTKYDHDYVKQYYRDKERENQIALENTLKAQEVAIKLYQSDHCTTTEAFGHPYIINKQITPLCAKATNKHYRLGHLLVIPIRDANYNLKSVQIIKPNGFKQAWSGTSYSGFMVWITPDVVPEHDYRGDIYICEGYSTGVSIRMAIEKPVVCALSANNLTATAHAIRRVYPHAKLTICADNDQWIDQSKPNKKNTGIVYALQAAKAVTARVIYPNFTEYLLTNKPTDFNDLLILGGVSAIQKQFNNQK